MGNTDFYHWLVSLLHTLDRLVQWCCMLEYLVIICWPFPVLVHEACDVIFFSVMIFFINSTFILFSCVNSCFKVLWYMVFRFSVFCISIRLGGYCFSVFSVSIRVGGSCSYSSQFTCLHISSISRSENQPSLITFQLCQQVFRLY